MEQYTYLLINFFSLLVPFILSFESRISYYKSWKYLFPAMTATALFFIFWDSVFTAQGVWGFNPKFVTGITVYNLPIEETLFFFCIPYASIFAYEALGLVPQLKVKNPKLISLVILTTCIIGVVLFNDKAYTFYTFLFLGIYLLLQFVWLKGEYLARFYFAYMIILIPFTIVNGLLTGSWIGEPVVWYNNAENLGVRFLTIPVEDVFYGMLMLLMSVSIYESLKAKTFFTTKSTERTKFD